jgi:hypothetical protein
VVSLLADLCVAQICSQPLSPLEGMFGHCIDRGLMAERIQRICEHLGEARHHQMRPI